MRLFIFLSAVVVGAALWSCNGNGTDRNANTPIMTRETPPPVTTSAESSMPHSGAGNFENLVADYESKDRVIWQKPGMAIAMLGDLKGKTVADIGAGTGYFTFRMVPLAEKVIGVDIDPRFISFMDSIKVRLPEQYRPHFESRLAKPDDPMLGPEEADAVIIVNTYGYIENRVQYLQRLSNGMKPQADLLIIDFKKNNLSVGPPDAYKISINQVEKELNAAGFQVEKIDNEALDYQYIVLAKKSNPADGGQ
ncbi:MAG: class I SAM-dependent methyltransferase [Lewinellaceae bacterium]|nr:class I SAM-dependent methyltransferase [Lewinellaceae bacterium]